MAITHMTWGGAAADLRQHINEGLHGVTPTQRVEDAHTAFIGWCADHDLDPMKTRLAFADYIYRYPHQAHVINMVTDYIPIKYSVRGVWTP